MYKNLLHIILTFLFANPIIVQSQALENSLLWEVKKEGIKDSYLYGTFHLLPQKDFELKEKVSKAFDASDQIVMELDMDDPNMQAELIQNILMKDGESLDALIGDEKYQKLSQFMMERLSMPLDQLKKVKPFFIVSMLLPTFIEGTPASYELVFVQRAQSQEKEIFGFETPSSQTMIFDNIPYEDQAEDLLEIVDDEVEMKNLFDEMISLYKAEQINVLHSKLVQYMNGENEERFLLIERNKNWIPKIQEYASSLSTFFAVGAGHLPGDQGVVNLLRKAGYTVRPIND